METSTIVRLIIAYMIGLPISFVYAASKKGVWWEKADRHWDKEHEVPIVMTVFWPIFFSCYFAYRVGRLMNLIFMDGIDRTIRLMGKTNEWLEKRKQEAAKPRPIRQRIATPEPKVNAVGYRDPAPKPCIACGIPTSLNQDHMEVVEQDQVESLPARHGA